MGRESGGCRSITEGTHDGFRHNHQRRHGRRRDSHAPLYQRHRDQGRQDRPDRRAERQDRRARSRRCGPHRGARLCRSPHPLRRADFLGPLLHAVRLARGDLGGARQLRVRLCSVAARGPRPRDAQHDPQRGDPLRRDEGGYAVELGHVPRFHRQPEPHAQRRQLPDLRAADPALCVGDGLGGGQEAAADRGGTGGNVPADPRGDGCRRMRLVGPGFGPEIDPARLRRDPDGHRPAVGTRDPDLCRDPGRPRRRLYRAGLSGDRRGGPAAGGRNQAVLRKSRRDGEAADPVPGRSAQRGASRNAPRADQMVGKLRRAGAARLRPGRHPARRVRDDLCRLEPVRRHRGLARSDPRDERRTQGQDARPGDAPPPQGGMGRRDPADDRCCAFGRQPRRASQERKDRYRRGIGVSDPARAGRNRRRVLLSDQDPRRLQAALEGVSAPGRQG